MRCLVVVLLLAGCMEEITLVESGEVKMSVSQTTVFLNVRGDRENCVVLPDSLHGAANGRRMTVLSHGDEDTSYGRFDLSGGTEDRWDETNITTCSNAELALPLAITREAPDEVVIEVADHSATFAATYPALFTPLTLTLASTQVIDGRLVVTWTASPSTRDLGLADVQIPTGGGYTYAYDLELSTEGNTVELRFPEPSKIQGDIRHTMVIGSTIRASQCDGFAQCGDHWRNDHIVLDPSLIEMALAL